MAIEDREIQESDPGATPADVDGEALHNVRVLERFSLLEVPAREAERIVEAVSGTDVNGVTLRLTPARA